MAEMNDHSLSARRISASFIIMLFEFFYIINENLLMFKQIVKFFNFEVSLRE